MKIVAEIFDLMLAMDLSDGGEWAFWCFVGGRMKFQTELFSINELFDIWMENIWLEFSSKVQFYFQSLMTPTAWDSFDKYEGVDISLKICRKARHSMLKRCEKSLKNWTVFMKACWKFWTAPNFHKNHKQNSNFHIPRQSSAQFFNLKFKMPWKQFPESHLIASWKQIK